MTLREIRYEAVKASTNTADEVVLLWWDAERRCHAGEDYWPEGRVPTVWDSSGLGTWDVADGVQCGTCGRYLRPHYEVLVNPSELDVATARAGFVERWGIDESPVPDLASLADWLGPAVDWTLDELARARDYLVSVGAIAWQGNSGRWLRDPTAAEMDAVAGLLD